MEAGHSDKILACWSNAISTPTAHHVATAVSFELLCLAIAIPIALFFVAPSFRRLRAKGYNPWHVAFPALVVFATSVIIGWFFHLAFAVALLTPVIYLLAAVILPARPGFSGDPQQRPCNQPSGSEPRLQARMGVAGVAGPSSLRWISGFPTPVDAELARIRLESEGVSSVVDGDVLAHVYPPIQSTGGGTTLLVEDKDLDSAMAALREPDKEEELSEDFASPKAVEEEVENDGVALSIFLFFILMIVLPFLILALRHNEVVTPFEITAAFRDAFILTIVILAIVFKKLGTAATHERSA